MHSGEVRYVFFVHSGCPVSQAERSTKPSPRTCDITDLAAPGIERSNAVRTPRARWVWLEIRGFKGWYLNLSMKIFFGGHRGDHDMHRNCRFGSVLPS